MGKIKKERIGEIKNNRKGLKMTIQEYKNNKNCVVGFENGELKKTTYWQFKTGQVKSQENREFVIDVENKDENGKYLKSYITWENMRTRCNNKNYLEKNPTYRGCKICDEWKKYSNFKKWYNKNFYQVTGEKMCLDKDILKKGNKLYSPSTCIFVPTKINTLFVTCKKNRGNLPIGVTFNKKVNKYVVVATDGHKSTKNLGSFNTVGEAFEVYKNYKENLIKDVAKQYKEKIPKKLYDAMIRYEIKITD